MHYRFLLMLNFVSFRSALGNLFPRVLGLYTINRGHRDSILEKKTKNFLLVLLDICWLLGKIIDSYSITEMLQRADGYIYIYT